MMGRLVDTLRKPTLPTSDVHVLDSGSVFDKGHLSYLWYEVELYDNGRIQRGFKVVMLRELWALPAPSRDDKATEPDMLDRTRTMLRGLYNAHVDLIYVAAGMFHEPRLGVVQVYGVTTFSESLESAVHRARNDMVGLEATMANFIASVIRPLDVVRTDFITQAIGEYPHALAVLGQPDPRESSGITDLETNKGGRPLNEKPAEQNEQFFRAMSRVNEDFVFFILGSRLPRRKAAELLEAAAHEASLHLGRSEGQTSFNVGMGLPIIFNRVLGDVASVGYGESEVKGQSDATSHVEGQAHSEMWGRAHSVGRFEAQSEMWGEAQTHATGHSVTESHMTSQAHTQGQAHTDGHAVTDGSAHTEGQSSGSSVSEMHGGSIVQGGSVVAGHSSQVSQQMSMGAGMQQSQGVSDMSGHADGWSLAHGAAQNSQAGGQIGIPGVSLSGGGTVSESFVGTGSDVDSMGHTESAQEGASFNVQAGMGASQGAQVAHGASQAQSQNWATVQSSSQAHMSSDTRSHAETNSTADTKSESDTVGQAQGRAETHSTMDATTRSHAWGVTQGQSESWTDSYGESDTKSQSDGVSHADSQAQGAQTGRAIAQASAGGVALGPVPSVGLSKSFRWQDMNETLLARLFERMTRLLDTISAEGGYLIDAYVLTRTEAGQTAAEAAIAQAFHGLEDVVTPVITLRLNDETRDHIRDHMMLFAPCILPARDPLSAIMGGGQFETLNTLHQASCLVAPSVFEEGTAATVRPRPPRFAYLPDLKGDVMLGHQYTKENYDAFRPTSTSCTLTPAGFFSTAFLGDTGAGKTVAAERMVYETTLKWQIRSLVFDFGKGWERLANADGLKEHVQVFHLTPTGINPLRWNPLQIGQRIDPITQRDAVAEIYAGVTGMGQRQLGYMQETLRALYIVKWRVK